MMHMLGTLLAAPLRHRPEKLLQPEGAAGYYEEHSTGSIFSEREVVAWVKREHVPLDQIGAQFQALPYGTCLLLEEAETIAANAEEAQDRDWLQRLWG